MAQGESGDTKRNRETNENNYKMNKENNETNLSIANANLDLQREQQSYERDLQQQLFQREDTAIQRQVADSRAAGVSPLANLSGASSTGVVANTTTPQNGFQSQASRDQAPPAQNMQNLQMAQAIIGSINEAANTLNTLQNGVSNRNAQAFENLLAQQQLSFNQNSLDDRLDAIKLSNAATRANTWKTWYQGANEYGKAQDYAISRHEREKYGILPGDSEKTRDIKKLISFLMPSDKGSQKYTKRFGDGPSVDYNMPYTFDRTSLNDFAKKYLDIDVDGLQNQGTDWLAQTTRNTLGKALNKVIDASASGIDNLVKSSSDKRKENADKYLDKNYPRLKKITEKLFGSKSKGSVSTGAK